MFGGIPNKHLTANLQQNLRVKEFGKKRSRSDRMTAMSLACFWPALYIIEFDEGWGSYTFLFLSHTGFPNESDCLFGQLDRILWTSDSEAGVKTEKSGGVAGGVGDAEMM